jgi:hypothetical protein
LIKEKHAAQGREKTKMNLARLREMAPVAWITSRSEQDRHESSREEEQRRYLLQATQEAARFKTGHF